MKKLLLLAAILVIAVYVTRHFYPSKPAKKEQQTIDQALSISKNSSDFDSAFSRLLKDYDALRDALVDLDSAGAEKAARSLGKKADNLPVMELKADSTIILTARNFATSISSEMKGFLGDDSIEEKKRSFNMLTDEIYNLIRTVRYGGQVIYHMRCPDAFIDSSEGYWLSESNQLINPYKGSRDITGREKIIHTG